MDKADKERILALVDRGLTAQFDGVYSWSNMIDDIEDLTAEEKEWAKTNVGYKAYMD